ncbi:MAG TPA: helix-turn-helix transcriptional regulator [Anaerolineae bacterium]|jgi:transcriptional regulator with XRE-family HTH domain|nr:helix-turn-helix transcriptional regulator [Anaerolineae bacterium]
MLKTLLKPHIGTSELAKEYGCSHAYVSRIAAGKQKPSARFKAFCVQKFGLPIEILFPEGDEHAR